VIQSFGSKETEELFHYHRSKRFRAIERVALRKLLQLHATTELRVLASPPGNQLEVLRGIAKANIRSELMISGEFALFGAMATAMTWKLSIIASKER
jgi:plasmid maintenance system killer protein